MGTADHPFAFLGLIVIVGRALKWLQRITRPTGNEKREDVEPVVGN
jgi:hypothetical protein